MKSGTNPNRLLAEAIPPARRIPTLAEDVRNHLLIPPRSLPPKYFYDQHGSELFDRICETPEYYVTRTEADLLEEVVDSIAIATRPVTVFELGSGMSRKTHRILEACQAVGSLERYAAFDISPDALLSAGDTIRKRLPFLDMRLFSGDYTAGLETLPSLPGPKLFLFLGGTIGNFDEREETAFLQDVAGIMGPEDYLLLGADRIKDRRVLNAAYNDSTGITAAFNRNILTVLNTSLAANFEPEAFRHDAHYNESRERIEMFLIAEKAHTVCISDLGENFELEGGEKILTELSRKFSLESLERLIAVAGLSLFQHYTAKNDHFSLVLARWPV